MKRVATGFVLGLFFAGLVATAFILGGGVSASTPGNWQVAGGEAGFRAEDFGEGQGVKQSIDEFIESLPADCDIELIPRGVATLNVAYRCPED